MAIINARSNADNNQGGETMKRFFIFFVILVIIITAFAGCSQNNQPPGATPTSTYVPYPDSGNNINNYNNGLAEAPPAGDQ
jgi:hypothetical protein